MRMRTVGRWEVGVSEVLRVGYIWLVVAVVVGTNGGLVVHHPQAVDPAFALELLIACDEEVPTEGSRRRGWHGSGNVGWMEGDVAGM